MPSIVSEFPIVSLERYCTCPDAASRDKARESFDQVNSS